jgi:protein-disulfide isomerase
MIAVLARAVLCAAVVMTAGLAAAAEPAPPVKYHEFAMGSPKAKVTIIEYASLTCPHCAHFQTETFPEIKKNYVDTGKVRFLLRDFPLDALAMAGAVVARCVAPEKGHKLVDLLFANQQDWVRSEKPLEPLIAHAKTAGISETEVDACLKNKTLLTALRDEQEKASEAYNIEATPAFYIGDENLQGAGAYADFAEVIDRQLAKATPKAKAKN